MTAIDLGIDTASGEPSLALLDGDRVVAERAWTMDTNVSQELLEALDALMRDAGVPREDIARIAVDVGPGGYSGLRSGVATAQGLALALDVPLAGVSRLEAEAYPLLLARPRGTAVVAVHDAGRAGVAWAAYTLMSEPDVPPQVLIAARIDPADEVPGHAPAGATWCGELSDALRAALGRDAEPASGDTVPRAHADAEARAETRAARLVRLARLHAAYGDPALVDVVYLRPPSITKPSITKPSITKPKH